MAEKPDPSSAGRDVRDDLVDQAGAQEGGGQRRAAFEPEVPDLVVVELPEHLGGVVGREQQRLGAVVADPRGRRDLAVADHDPQRLPVGRYVVLVANRQLGIVVQHRLGADGNRVALGALAVHVGAGERCR